MSEPASPADWVHVALVDMAEVNPESLGAGTASDLRFQYIDLSSVDRGEIDWSSVQELTFAAAPSRARRLVRPGDVLFGTVRPALQSHGAIPAGWADGTLVASTGFSVIRARRSTADQRFLFHFILSDAVTSEARRVEVGSNYPAVNEADVRRLQIPKPPLPEQRQIAEILDTINEAILGTEQLIAKLQQMQQGLFQDLLTRGIDDNGELRDPERYPEQFQQSSLGKIPSSWKVVRVIDAGTVKLGRQRAPQFQHGPNLRPYLRVANVFDGAIDTSDILWMNFTPQEQQTFGLQPGDVLLNEGQSLELVGRSALYEGQPNAYCFQNTLIRFRADSTRCEPRFARAVFKWWLDIGRFMKVALQTTSVAHLGADRFANMDFPLPCLQEQQEVMSALDAARCQIEIEACEAAKLRSLQQGLMNDLLTGRVHVTPLLDVEPA